MAGEKFLIHGGMLLEGQIAVSGGKNAAVAIIPAALMVDGVCRLENIPQISDADMLMTILEHLGAKIRMVNRNTVEIDCTDVRYTDAPYDLMRRIRASYYLIGAMLGRFGAAKTTMPGGCNFGVRPIDQHIKGFRALGAEVDDRYGMVEARTTGLVGTEVFLDCVTVGGTINVMLAAARAQGNTMIFNAAKEPHVVDTANFLNSMGARVHGAGTDVIRIRGTQRLHGCTYTVIPDQIETGTLMIAAAATQGDVTLHGCIPAHMEALSAKLLEMGVRVDEQDDVIRVRSLGGHRAVNIKTQAYPGFPTDLQQPMSALLTTASGTSTVVETIFDKRFKHLDEMLRMGARAHISDRMAVIEGMPGLLGAPVYASDLRAGAALVIAGLMASGDTEIGNPQYIDRGYEKLEERLSALGAQIRRVMMQE